ncbi:MAG: response regulator, partial [Bacteroidota bacterium]|nr:response regulator [Bacteroidota bacterium]
LSKVSFIKEIIREKSDRLYTKTYFKHEDDFVHNQHYYSNIWGALQLYKVHQIIEKGDCEQPLSLSEVHTIPQLQEPFSFFESYQGLVMRLLYDINNSTIQQELKYLNKKIEYLNLENETWEKLEEIAVQKEAELAKLELSQREIENFYEQIKLDGLINKIWKFFGGQDKNALSFIQEKLQDIEHQKDLISHIRGKIEILKKRKSHQDEILNVFNHSNIGEKSSGYITTIQELRKAAPSVLLIDDKAKEGGWGYIYQLMIYGFERPDKFHTYQPNKNESIEDMVDGIKNIIARNSIDIILLDIRLKDERGYIGDIDNVSGIALLKKLKKDWLSIPIIVATASKQKLYYTSCMQNRAIYFWTKPGIEDANWSARELVLNYYSLIRTINIIITNPVINFIYKDFIPLRKEFSRATQEYEFALKYLLEQEPSMSNKELKEIISTGFGMPEEDFKEVKKIISTSFEIMIEKLQFSLQTDEEYIDFSQRNMSLVLFLLSFCFEKKVKSAYKKRFQNYNEKIVLLGLLLNIVHNNKDAYTDKEKRLPVHLYRFNLIRNNNTHESLSKVENLRYYTLLFFNSLYCEIQNIGEGCERILMRGRITKKEEKYCRIVETDTGKEVIISRKQNSDKKDKIEDKKEYIFVLERQIKLFDSTKDNSTFKVKSKGIVEGYPKQEPEVYYIHDFNLHRNFFFSKKESE